MRHFGGSLDIIQTHNFTKKKKTGEQESSKHCYYEWLGRFCSKKFFFVKFVQSKYHYYIITKFNINFEIQNFLNLTAQNFTFYFKGLILI